MESLLIDDESFPLTLVHTSRNTDDEKENIPKVSNHIIVCIDGQIGAGKSTLIKRLSKDYLCFPEPLDEWTLLPYLYKNPTIYAAPFQFQVLLSQFNQKQSFLNSLNLVERCPWTSRNVFAPMFMEEDVLCVYDKLFQILAYNVDYFIYLDVDPIEAYRRIHNRSEIDSQISLDYLYRLYHSYKINLLVGRSNVFVAPQGNTEEAIKEFLKEIQKKI